MLKAGWYLDATVALDGLKQTVGVYHSDSNLPSETWPGRRRSPTARKYPGIPPGDTLLVDADGSGGFENDVFQSKAYPFGPILYLGGKLTRLRRPRIANP